MKERIDCKDIILKYLNDNGFDGLCNTGECGCSLSDLAPCESDFSYCEPAYRCKGDDGDLFTIIKAEEK